MTTQTISNPAALYTLDHSNLNTSIQETFTAIDRFEWLAPDQILLMRQHQIYLNASTQPPTIQVDSILAHADLDRILYVERGEVVEDLREELVVAWECWKTQSKKTSRYFLIRVAILAKLTNFLPWIA